MSSTGELRGGPTTSGLLGILGSAYRQSPRRVSAATILTLVGTACAVYVPLGLRQVIVAVGTPDVWGAIAVLSAVALTSAAANTTASLALASVGERLVQQLRSSLGSVVMRMPIGRLRALGHGTLIARATADTAQVRAAIDLSLAQIPAAVLSLVCSVAIMAWLDLALVAVTVSCFTLGGIGVALLLRRIRRHASQQQIAIGRFAQQLAAGMQALPVIRAFRVERDMIEQLDILADDAAQAGLTTMRMQAATTPVLELTQQVAVVSVLAVGGYRITQGSVQLADLAAFMLYLFQLVMPLVTIGTGLGRLSAALASNDRVAEIVREPTELTERSEPVSRRPEINQDAVSVTSLDFAFDVTPVLSGVDFRIPARGLTAIVGPSGAGKTTLLKLIEGFETPTAGDVRVFGKKPQGEHLAWARQQMSYVDQEGTLYPGTLRRNLTLGRRDVVADDELTAVMHQLGLADLVADLPDGLDTDLSGARGLSGGQRQRVAIARATIANAPLMLLDEPTAHLDRLSETAVHNMVTTAKRSGAVILVAHRMRTVIEADRVLVLDQGKLVDSGCHDELTERCDAYRALLAEQHLVGSS